jgi:hypothetical protein
MYKARFQRFQYLDVSFTEEDYALWKKSNPHSIHTHENYSKELCDFMSEDDDCWSTMELDLICIISGSDRE